MYTNMGQGIEAEIDPPSLNGTEILYSDAYIWRRMRERANLPDYAISYPGRHAEQAVNLYGYVNNRPCGDVDPYGLAPAGTQCMQLDCEDTLKCKAIKSGGIDAGCDKKTEGMVCDAKNGCKCKSVASGKCACTDR